MSPLDRLARALGVVIAALLAVTAALLGMLLLGVIPAHAEPFSCGDQCNGNMPTGGACAHIGTLGPGFDGQPATECQRVDDPANPQQWVVIPDVVIGNPCPTDWLGQVQGAVGLKCTLVDGILRWEQP